MGRAVGPSCSRVLRHSQVSFDTSGIMNYPSRGRAGTSLCCSVDWTFGTFGPPCRGQGQGASAIFRRVFRRVRTQTHARTERRDVNLRQDPLFHRHAYDAARQGHRGRQGCRRHRQRHRQREDRHPRCRPGRWVQTHASGGQGCGSVDRGAVQCGRRRRRRRGCAQQETEGEQGGCVATAGEEAEKVRRKARSEAGGCCPACLSWRRQWWERAPRHGVHPGRRGVRRLW